MYWCIYSILMKLLIIISRYLDSLIILFTRRKGYGVINRPIEIFPAGNAKFIFSVLSFI